MSKSPKDDSKKEYVAKRWIACPLEDEYFGEDRKFGKQDRKKASAKDRSKYKKTDREKFQKSAELQQAQKLPKDNLLRGRVLSINPEGIIVEHQGQRISCTLRGLMKKERGLHKNIVTVGDFVLFELSEASQGLIAQVEPRKSVLSRADNLSRRKEQIIASNIDQVIISGSVVNPLVKPPLLDRYVIAARKGGMEPLIVINKIDLLQDESVDPVVRLSELENLKIILEGYESAGIRVIPVSIVTGEGLDLLRDAMKDKASVFSGQSGVGKSSLINAVTGWDLKVGKVVDKTKKGAHTTTTAQFLELPFGGWCIDTPGIKSFGVWDLDKDEVEQYFSEIYECGHKCRFPNCSHTQETECAVIEAVKNGTISPLRYQSYAYLLHSVLQEHVRR